MKIVDCVFHLHRYLSAILKNLLPKFLVIVLLFLITQVVIKSTAFLFILFVFFFKNINNYCEAAILKISASVFSSCGVITARHDVILNQSEHIHFYNHLSNHTKFVCFVFKFGENSSIPCFKKFLLFCSDPGNIER